MQKFQAVAGKVANNCRDYFIAAPCIKNGLPWRRFALAECL